jgi:hypothetical protein
MGLSAVSIDVSAGALAYLEQKFLSLFGKDSETKESSRWFADLQRTALTLTKSVQCLGMRDPVPFASIYQPTRLIVGADPDDAIASDSLVYSTESHTNHKRDVRSCEQIHVFLPPGYKLPDQLNSVTLHGVTYQPVVQCSTLPLDGLVRVCTLGVSIVGR